MPHPDHGVTTLPAQPAHVLTEAHRLIAEARRIHPIIARSLADHPGAETFPLKRSSLITLFKFLGDTEMALGQFGIALTAVMNVVTAQAAEIPSAEDLAALSALQANPAVAAEITKLTAAAAPAAAPATT